MRGRRPFDVPLHPLGLVPATSAYWRFSGSLTTPPCTEGLRWLVLQNLLTTSPTQARAFEAVTGRNARPVQRLWARRILTHDG